MHINCKRIAAMIGAAVITVMTLVPTQTNAASTRYEIIDFACEEGTVATLNNRENEKVFKDVPLYNQMDYPDVPYSKGTIATSGCGITCAAMIASYYRDEAILPDELAYTFNNGRYGNDEKMENALEYYEIPFERTYSWKKVCEALENGHKVISLHTVGLFTDYGHFIVLSGMTEEGNIIVKDPNGWNWSGNPDLKEGFANGFTHEQITDSGGTFWICG